MAERTLAALVFGQHSDAQVEMQVRRKQLQIQRDAQVDMLVLKCLRCSVRRQCWHARPLPRPARGCSPPHDHAGEPGLPG